MKFSEHSALRALVEGTAGETGEEFFRSLVRNLAVVMETGVAWVTEYLPASHRLRALAMWAEGAWVDDYEYDLKGTPCAPVMESSKLVHFPDRLLELFPDDPDLEPLGAVSYMGVPFLDSDGRILGHLAVMDRKPMPEDARKLALFHIFANRATAELRRLRVEDALRARERELGGLVESAMDAILELDPEGRIMLINSAGEKLFGCRAEEVMGEDIARFLAKEDVDRLCDLMGKLQHLPASAQHLWVPGGFEAQQVGGERFHAEATLSLFEVEREFRTTLILRNVNDRIEAERRIRSLTLEARILREELRELHDVDAIIGDSEPMTQLLAQVRQVADTSSTVLLQGETGTGKELVARAVHAASPRREKPLIKVNCAAIPATLMESEFFGHVKGAFTGATAAREGRFALADGGTIFLDEIGELPLDLQAKLLRVLQEGEFEPVGSSAVQKVDVRVIAATNRDLQKAVREREFREDLFYRLNVFPLRVPPLRERGDDIGLLARAFAAKYDKRMGRRIEPLSDACVRQLKMYSWPGNVRELQNVIERSVITSQDGLLDLGAALPAEHVRTQAESRALDPSASPQRVLSASEMRDLERKNLVAALNACHWRVAGQNGAASLIGMKPSTLSSRIKALGITRPG